MAYFSLKIVEETSVSTFSIEGCSLKLLTDKISISVVDTSLLPFVNHTHTRDEIVDLEPIDADTLNGYSASAFALKEHEHSGYLKVDQSTPQVIENGIPILCEDRKIVHPNQIVDKKYVDEVIAHFRRIFISSTEPTENLVDGDIWIYIEEV